jgi:hypothetical protein
MATKAEIMADTSDLSSDDLSRLFDKIYLKVLSNRPWEFTKKTATLTQSTSVPYVTLPSDFGYPVQNYNYTGTDWYAEGSKLLVGTTSAPYTLIPFSDRNRYQNASNKAYIDAANNRLVFTLQPTAANSFNFDYHSFGTTLGLNDSPAFPAAYHPIIYHGMVADDFMIQLFDKARSYREENMAQYREYFSMLASWNFSLAPQT